MARTLTLKFTPTPDDYARTVTMMTLRRWPVRIFTAVMAAAPLGGMYLLLSGGETQSYVALYFLLIPLVYFAFIFWLNPTSTKRKIVASERLRSPSTWVVGTRTLTIKNAYKEHKLAWRDFSPLVEHRQYFLLPYRDKPRVYHFLPRRVFETPEQEQAFLELARQGILQSVRTKGTSR
jgi:hypothetical protein